MTPQPGDQRGGAVMAPQPGDQRGGAVMAPRPGDQRGGAVMAPQPGDQRGGAVRAPVPATPRGSLTGALARRSLMSGVAAALGLLTIAWPVAWAPGWTYAVSLAGAAAVLAAAFAGWPRGAVIAVAAAIASCAFSRAGIAVLTAEGLFILGYLIAAHAPAGLSQPGLAGRWLRYQARLCVAGVIASGAVLAAFALHPADSAWLTVAGLAAAVAAYLIALPSLRDRRRSRRSGSGQPPDAVTGAGQPVVPGAGTPMGLG